jgi:nucleotide-binding universal stress UspA family protein
MLSRHSIQRKNRRPKITQSRTSWRLARILVPLDFSAESKYALRYAADLARHLGAGLILLHVVEPLVSQADFGYGCVTRRFPNRELLKATQARLNSIGKRFCISGPRPLAFVRTGAAETEIVQAARDIAADLIVIGSHGGDPASMPIGRTAETVVRNASCPVLVARNIQPQSARPQKRELNETQSITSI